MQKLVNVIEKTQKRFSRHGVYGTLFVFSALNFLMLIYDLLFGNGAEAWTHFGKAVLFLFVGLIILGFTDPKN